MLTYIISLNEPTKKIEYLQNFGLDPIWIEGVNGQQIGRETTRENVLSFHQYLCPKSAVGIAMSHFKVWKEFLKTDKGYAIVFEDDVLLENFFTDYIYNAINNVPLDYDVLYLGCFGCDQQQVSNVYKLSGLLYGSNQRNKQLNDFIAIPEYAYGMHAYVISRQGAAKLLNLLDKKIYDHVDMMLQSFCSKNMINAYVTTPRLAYQTSTDTSISENVKSKHPKILTSALRNYEVDRMVRGDYQVTTAYQQIGPYIINLITIFFLLLGVVASYFKLPISYLTVFYLVISLPDLYDKDRLLNFNTIILNYFVFVVPTLIKISKNTK